MSYSAPYGDIHEVYGLTVTSEPSEEPVTTSEAKQHLRVDTSDDDTYIDGLITAARQHVEQYLSRALVTTEYTMTLDHFSPYIAWWPVSMYSSTIYLPRAPVQSVDEIRYIDDGGTQQTLASSRYRVDKTSLVARVTPAYAETWPTTRPVTNAVEIDFTAGYGAATEVPKAIKQAILLLVGTMYDPVRADVVVGFTPEQMPFTAKSLLGPYRVATFPGS